MHEAREIIRAKDWQSFLTQSIADVNAMSRAVKRLCIVIISQFIRDITSDMRYTINFYCKVSRPRGKHARLYINVMWKDDRDVDKPKLRKRKLSGYLVYPNGIYKRYIPQYLDLKKPSKEIAEEFDKADTECHYKPTIVKIIETPNKQIMYSKMRAGINILDINMRGTITNQINLYQSHLNAIIYFLE